MAGGKQVYFDEGGADKQLRAEGALKGPLDCVRAVRRPRPRPHLRACTEYRMRTAPRRSHSLACSRMQVVKVKGEVAIDMRSWLVEKTSAAAKKLANYAEKNAVGAVMADSDQNGFKHVEYHFETFNDAAAWVLRALDAVGSGTGGKRVNLLLNRLENFVAVRPHRRTKPRTLCHACLPMPL